MKSLSSLKSSKGFTLIEMLVALALLAILAFLAASAFDGSRSKAQAMIGFSRQLADANIQLKTDTGCYVSSPVGLFDPSLSDGNNYCGNRTFGNTWSRPYLSQYPVDGTRLKADKIGSGVTVGFNRIQESVNGRNVWRYFVEFTNVPEEVVVQALVECNDTQDVITSFENFTCKGNPANGTFDFLYDTTRR